MPERGDLLLVPFPFTDLSAAKRRRFSRSQPQTASAISSRSP